MNKEKFKDFISYYINTYDNYYDDDVERLDVSEVISTIKSSIRCYFNNGKIIIVDKNGFYEINSEKQYNDFIKSMREQKLKSLGL
jgi:hypothetical protein